MTLEQISNALVADSEGPVIPPELEEIAPEIEAVTGTPIEKLAARQKVGPFKTREEYEAWKAANVLNFR